MNGISGTLYPSKICQVKYDTTKYFETPPSIKQHSPCSQKENFILKRINQNYTTSLVSRSQQIETNNLLIRDELGDVSDFNSDYENYYQNSDYYVRSVYRYPLRREEINLNESFNRPSYTNFGASTTTGGGGGGVVGAVGDNSSLSNYVKLSDSTPTNKKHSKQLNRPQFELFKSSKNQISFKLLPNENLISKTLTNNRHKGDRYYDVDDDADADGIEINSLNGHKLLLRNSALFDSRQLNLINSQNSNQQFKNLTKLTKMNVGDSILAAAAVNTRTTNNSIQVGYINILGDQSLIPKYLTATVKLKSPDKNLCDKLNKVLAKNLSSSSAAATDVVQENKKRKLKKIASPPQFISLKNKLKPINKNLNVNQWVTPIVDKEVKETKRVNRIDEIKKEVVKKEKPKIVVSESIDTTSSKQQQQQQLNEVKNSKEFKKPKIPPSTNSNSKKSKIAQDLLDEEQQSVAEYLEIKEIEKSISSFGSSNDNDNTGTSLQPVQKPEQEPKQQTSTSNIVRPSAPRILKRREKIPYKNIEPSKEVDEEEPIVKEVVPIVQEKNTINVSPANEPDLELNLKFAELLNYKKTTETIDTTEPEDTKPKYKYQPRIAEDNSMVQEEKPKDEAPRKTKIDLSNTAPLYQKRIRFLITPENISEEKDPNDEDDETPPPVNWSDDWLIKWCILSNSKTKKTETIFKRLDTNKKGYLKGATLLNAINSLLKLNNSQMSYLFSVLSLCNLDPFKNGCSLNLFKILMALADRINHLDDEWFRNVLPQLDLSAIENKMFKVKNLWNFLVDQSTKQIHINDLMIEFEAGGVTTQHIEFAREKFSNKSYFDLMDYLTYIPLFVYIHDKIIKNPLSNEKDI